MAKIKRQPTLWQKIQKSKSAQRTMAIILPLLFGVVIITLWQTGVLHILFNTDTFTLPLPDRIIAIFGENIDKIWENILSTVAVAGIGLVGGSLIGYLAAVIASCIPGLGKGGLVVVGAMASIPIVALAPVISNWTKDVSKDASIRSMVAKIIVVAVIAAADMGLNAYRGLTEIKLYSDDLMKTYAAGVGRTFTKLRLPNSIPYVFVALKVSVPASVMTAIVSEYFAEYITGVGRQIRENIVLAQYSTAWAYIVAACLIGLAFYGLLMLLQNILLKRYH